MTHIICRATTCVFWEQGICSAEEIEYDPDDGCQMFQDLADLDVDEEAEEEEDLYWDTDSGGSTYDGDDDWEDDWEEDDHDEEDEDDGLFF